MKPSIKSFARTRLKEEHCINIFCGEDNIFEIIPIQMNINYLFLSGVKFVMSNLAGLYTIHVHPQFTGVGQGTVVFHLYGNLFPFTDEIFFHSNVGNVKFGGKRLNIIYLGDNNDISQQLIFKSETQQGDRKGTPLPEIRNNSIPRFPPN